MKKASAIAALLFYLLWPRPAAATGDARLIHGAGYIDYSTISSAISYAVSGDEVLVAAGTYSEQVAMKAGVDLRGGYSAADWSWNPDVNVTTIDGGGLGSVVTAADAAISGFTITDSAGTGIVAGVYVSGCSPAISGNKITHNGKYGIYVEGAASPVIETNVIADNSDYGIYCYSFGDGGTPLIYNNTIDGDGGGIETYAFSPVIKNNAVTSNAGYGIYNDLYSSPIEDYNDVWGSTGGDYYNISAGPHDISADPLYVGGGDYHLQTSPTPSPCIGAGVDVGLPYSNASPDIGAYQTTATPWPPFGLLATPGSANVMLTWQAVSETGLAGYKVSYGNVSGSYTNTIDAGNVTSYDVVDLINDATYFFVIQAYGTGGSISGYSDEVSATPTAGTHELPHYNYDASYGEDCTNCHYTNAGSDLLPQGFDYRYSTELCLSCHNLTGEARDMVINQASSHPVFVNASAGGGRLPTYGDITGRFSNRMGDHLKGGTLIVCNTCHNIMEKTEDPGRAWEMTTFTGQDSWKTYALQRGGWSGYDYLTPEVYSSGALISAPTYTKDRDAMELDAGALSDYNPGAGTITFAQPFYDYAYVTLWYPYLRVGNSGNAMCSDCHVTATHQSANCLTCHQSHNYTNLSGIRSKVKTPVSGIRNVVFTNITGAGSFADGDSTYDGICEVCHTTTKYYRNDGTGFVNHSGGVNYTGKDCVTCHTHQSGFAKY